MNEKPRKVKGGDYKLNISLNQEQKEAKGIILANKLTILKGFAGSGKTQIAVAVALDQLLKKQVDKIIVSRPLVTTGEELGFLKGDIKDKTLPFLLPIYDNMYNCLEKMQIDSLLEAGIIQISPFAYLRGRTFVNSFVIVDEGQNCTHQQLESVVTRLGLNSRMVITGDMHQCDLKDKKQSGFPFLKNLERIKDVAFVDLKTNHRDSIVEEVLKVYNEFRD